MRTPQRRLKARIRGTICVRVFEGSVRPIVRTIPLLPRVVMGIEREVTIYLVLMVLASGLYGKGSLFDIFRGTFNAPRLRRRVGRHLCFLIVELCATHVGEVCAR